MTLHPDSLLLRWSLLLHHFVPKVCSFISYAFILPFIQFIKSLSYSFSCTHLSDPVTLHFMHFWSVQQPRAKPYCLSIHHITLLLTRVTRFSLIHSTYPNQFKTFQSTLSVNFSLASTLRHTVSFLNLSILVSPHISRRYFSSLSSILCLSSFFKSNVSAS